MVVCEVCGKEFKNNGALNLHKYYKHENGRSSRNNGSGGKKKGMLEKDLFESSVPDNCRLLDSNIPLEKRAIDEGYIYIDEKENMCYK